MSPNHFQTSFLRLSDFPNFLSVAASVVALTSCLRISETANCSQVERICSDGENPTDFFYRIIGPLLFVLLLLSFMASLALQHLSNYHNVFSLTKKLWKPIIHPSIFVDFLDDDELPRKVSDLINSASPEIINQPDPTSGNTW